MINVIYNKVNFHHADIAFKLHSAMIESHATNETATNGGFEVREQALR